MSVKQWKNQVIDLQSQTLASTLERKNPSSYDGSGLAAEKIIISVKNGAFLYKNKLSFQKAGKLTSRWAIWHTFVKIAPESFVFPVYCFNFPPGTFFVIKSKLLESEGSRVIDIITELFGIQPYQYWFFAHYLENDALQTQFLALKLFFEPIQHLKHPYFSLQS